MLLSLREVTKTYPGAEAAVLRGVSFDMDAGKMLALTGEPGSGKSTLLHLVGGLDTADCGVVAISGTNLTPLEDVGRAALRHCRVDFPAVQPDPFVDGGGQHRVSGAACGAP